MNRSKAWLAAGLAALACTAARSDIALVGITEAKGSGAVAGTNFRSGYQLAVDEVNAAGGILGQRVVVQQLDIDTTPEAAVEATKQAVAAKPFAILGPVFSGLTLASMPLTAGTGIPHFTGGEAASLARKFHPTLLRTALTQQGAVPRLASFAIYGLGARKLATIWVDNEFGRDGHAVLLGETARRRASIVFDAPAKPGQKDFADLVKRAADAKPDALVLYLNEGESIDALKELHRHGFDKPVIGDGPLVSPKVIDGAHGAAEGTLAHTGISTDTASPQMQRFVAAYQRRFGARPDHNSVKGYFAVQVVKAGVEMAGQLDQKVFLDKVKNTRLDEKRFPGLMTTASYDMFGDLNRESYLVQVTGGRTRVLASLGATDNPFVEVAGGRPMPLDSNEFRRELAAALGRGEAAPPVAVATRGSKQPQRAAP